MNKEANLSSTNFNLTDSEDISEYDNEVYNFLSTLKEFVDLPSLEIKKLASVSRIATYEPGQYISIEGGAENTAGFILVSGVVSMIKNSTSGKILTVELLQAGDLFGLLLMLAVERLPAQLSARSLQNVKVIWVPIKSFSSMLLRYPIVFKDFVAHLLICLQSSYNISRGLAHDRVDVRIAAILTSLALKFSRPLSQDKMTAINFTRQQLADLTGTTPETAIRVTRAMQRDGLIDIKRPGIIRITDINGLQALSES